MQFLAFLLTILLLTAGCWTIVGSLTHTVVPGGWTTLVVAWAASIAPIFLLVRTLLIGGYPSAPALVAAVATRRPTLIHEQNAVLGRTNRMLAPAVGTVASAFPTLGRAPANLFDTQIAAGFAALPYPVALSKLVLEFTGVRLGKGLTFSHWDQRPLSAMQLRYAADDVRYLPLVRDKIGKRLDTLGHADWAKEECGNLCDASLYRFDPQTQYLRVRGASGLQKTGRAACVPH